MRWTKVRKLVRDSFADSVRDRVDVRVTPAAARALHDRCNEGWILVDGDVVLHADPHYLRKLTATIPIPRQRGADERVVLTAQPRPRQRVPQGALVAEFLDFPQACWEYLHSNLNDALSSPDPVISSLAVLNSKVGQQRLRRAATRDLHPLTRAMLDFRIEAERDARRTPRATVNC